MVAEHSTDALGSTLSHATAQPASTSAPTVINLRKFRRQVASHLGLGKKSLEGMAETVNGMVKERLREMAHAIAEYEHDARSLPAGGVSQVKVPSPSDSSRRTSARAYFVAARCRHRCSCCAVWIT